MFDAGKTRMIGLPYGEKTTMIEDVLSHLGHIKNIHLHRCKHKTVKLTLTRLSFRNRDRRRTKTGTNQNPYPNRYRIRCPDPIARIHEALS